MTVRRGRKVASCLVAARVWLVCPIALLLLSASFAATDASGQSGRDPGLTLVGRGRVSAIYDIEAAPPYAYALERGMVRVLDVRDPVAIREVSSLAFEGARPRMALRHPYLYLAGGGQPLGVIDVSDPVRPRWRGEIPELTGAPGDVFELAGDVAYLVKQVGPDGRGRPLRLDVVDVATDPAQPRRLGSVDLGARATGECGGVAQANGRAFVLVERPAGGANWSELVIVDATVPATPRVVRIVRFPAGKRYRDVDVRGDLLYLLDSSPQQPNGLAIYRVRDEGEPELVGEALGPDMRLPIDLIVRGDLVYGTFKVGSLLVTFDVSSPASPKIAHAYQQKDRWSAGLGMALVGDRLYVTGDGGPAPIFDVSAAAAPRLLGRWEYEGGSASDVIVDGALAVLNGTGGDLFFYDVSNPVVPARVGVYHGVPPGESSAWQWNVVVAASGPRALVAFETLPAQVLDISHPDRPAAQGTFTPRGLVHALALTRTHAFLGYRAPAAGKTPSMLDPTSLSRLGGIESVDLRDPRAPRAIADLPLDAAVTDLARHGDRLVAVHADGSLTVVDVRLPDQPAVVGRLTGGVSNEAGLLARPTRVALSADGVVAYVTRGAAAPGEGTLAVVDLRDAAAPRLLGQLSVARSAGAELPLGVDGTRVAVLAGGTDVLIVDASNAVRPMAVVRYTLPQTVRAEGLFFNEGTVFVAAGEDGLLILRLAPRPQPAS
jgi:hypothetical protein